jgi:hypothetical protein
VLVVVVGPEADVELVVVAGAVVLVVAEVAVRAGNDAADLVVGDPAGASAACAAGRAAVVAVVDVSRVVAVDGLEGAGPSAEDVAGSAGAMAAGLSVPPLRPQAEQAMTSTATRAGRRRIATTISAVCRGRSRRRRSGGRREGQLQRCYEKLFVTRRADLATALKAIGMDIG